MARLWYSLVADDDVKKPHKPKPKPLGAAARDSCITEKVTAEVNKLFWKSVIIVLYLTTSSKKI